MSATSVLIDIIGRDNASPAFDKAALAAERSARRMSGASAALTKTGAVMTKRVTVPIVALAAASVYTAVKFQKSMTLIQTAGGETAAQTAEISKGIKTLAVETGTSLDALGEGIYTVAKAGSSKWSAAGQLNVLKAAAQGAKAENVDLGTSVNALTSVMMSYGIGAGKAVQVENQLIKGSGLAKTSMQDYAGSLSTVVPLASKAGISFAQVAGAIATLTQHGTSAEESTQELANTIRNLQAPSQVAQKAMQQIGLGVTDVTHNLGRRGLTGTLDLIENKMAHSSKAGMIVVDTFKRSAAAGKDLGVMIGKMPKGLADLSRGLIKGSTNIKDYTAGAKSLGGRAGAMGLQFLSLYKGTKGFNDLLKSGQPAQRTAAAELRDIMGGATGLNTALQLGGESAGYFKSAVREVGSTAKDTGKDVAGWSKTQATLAVQWEKTKGAIQVVGLEIGQALIPALDKMVGYVRKGVEWWINLDGSTKKIIGTSALVLAALGPVLGILGRIGTVGRGMGRVVGAMAGMASGATRLAQGLLLANVSNSTYASGMFQAGMRIRAGQGLITGAAGKIAAALGGAGIGFAIGELTQHATDAQRVLGGLASVAGGAAAGFALGGPIGAAVGGFSALVGNVASAFRHSGDSAKAAAKAVSAALAAEKHDASDLLATLQSVNGAYAEMYKSQVAEKLRKGGALDAAPAAHVNPADLVNATLGDPGALKRYMDQIKRDMSGTPLYNKDGSFLGMKAPDNKSYEAAAKLQKMMFRLAPATRDAEKEYELYAKALGRSVVPANLLAGGLKNLDKELAGTGTGLDQNTAYGMRNAEVIRDNVKALQDQAVHQASEGKAAGDVTTHYYAQTVALENLLVKRGFDRAEVEKTIAAVSKMPASVQTKVEINARKAQGDITELKKAINNVKQGKIPGLTAKNDAGKAVIKEIQAKIDAIKQGKVPSLDADGTTGKAKVDALQSYMDAIRQNKVPGITANTAAARQMLDDIQAKINALQDKTVNVYIQTHGSASASRAGSGGANTANATGGAIRGPGTGTSDSILARLSNGEHVLTADEVRKAGGQDAIYRMRSLIQRGVLRFAKGGAVKAKAKAKAKTAEKRSETLTSIDTAIGKVGQPYSPPFDVSGTSISRVYAQIAAARKLVAKDLREGLITGKDASRMRSRLTDLAKYAKSAFAKAAVGKAITQIGQAPAAAPFQVADVGISRINAQIATAQRKVASERRHGGITAAEARHYREQIARLRAIANSQLGSLKAKIKGVDSSALRTALKGTADDVRSAFSTMITDAIKAGASKAEQARMRANEADLIKKMGQRTVITDKLAKAQQTLTDRQQEYTDMHDAVSGAMSGAGDLTGVQSTYRDRPLTADTLVKSKLANLDKAKKFTSILEQLAKEGLDQADLMALASEGPIAGYDEALALSKATPAQIKQLTSAQSALDKLGGEAGKALADKFKKPGVDAAKGIVDGLKSQESAINKAIAHLADGMLKTLRTKLKIHSPSRETFGDGAFTGKGFEGGILSRVAHVRKATAKLSEAARPPAVQHGDHDSTSSGANRPSYGPWKGVHIEHLEINEQSDPVATANAVMRRLSTLGSA
jgi:TP901 family phage tail tape measure protein